MTITLRQTRVVEVPMWKAFAPANAARNGLFAAQLAQRGVTGPVRWGFGMEMTYSLYKIELILWNIGLNGLKS